MHLSDVSAQIRRVLPANLISRVRLLLLVLAGASTVTIVPIIVIGSRGGIGTQLL